MSVPRSLLVILLMLLATLVAAADLDLPAARAEADARFRAGDVAGARALYRALADRQLAAGDTSSHAALTVLFDLGACDLRLGELGPARRRFEQAVAGFESRRPLDPLALALALEGLAATLVAQEDPATARGHLDRARALRQPIYPDHHPQMARLDALDGRLARLDGRTDDAMQAMERAKQAYRKIHGNVHPTVATMVRNFADLYLDQGNLLDALLMAHQADQITRKVYGEVAAERVNTLAALGRVHWALEQHQQAEDAYRSALTILDAHGRTSLLEVVACELGLGRSLLAAGRASEARAALTRAGQAYERAWWLAGSTESRATFMASPYPMLAAAELLAGDPGSGARAWLALEQHHGRTVRHARWLAALDPLEQARRDSLLERKLAVSRRIEQLAASHDTATLASARRERSRIEAALAEFEQALQAQVEDHATLQPDAVPTAADGTALLGWLDVPIAPDRLTSWAWVIAPGKALAWLPLDHGDQALAAADDLREGLIGDVAPDRIADAARRVHAARVAPCLPLLGDASLLMMVPGEVMAGVPLAILQDQQGRYLQERFAVTVLPWAGAGERGGSRRPGRPTSLLALADPPFTPGHAAAMARGQHDSDGRAVSRGDLAQALRGGREALASLARLPGTRREVAAVASHFPHTDVLLGPSAREDALAERQRAGRLASYDVIHLATHALVDAERSERSALVLSQVAPSPVADGLLTANEVMASWRLSADLVTLSACETGLGRPAPGEGYLGFTQAFLAAGARSVLVSLWQVDDRATALLMERFYANRAEGGLGKAAALREAQGWLRQFEAGGRRPFADARYWGGFVLVGEG